MDFGDWQPQRLVRVIKCLSNGQKIDDYMSPMLAMLETLSPENGNSVKSLWIDWGNVSAANLDTSGGGFSAELSAIRAHSEPDSAGEINWH